MAAKDVRFSTDARDKMLHGVDVLADCWHSLKRSASRAEGRPPRCEEIT